MSEDQIARIMAGLEAQAQTLSAQNAVLARLDEKVAGIAAENVKADKLRDDLRTDLRALQDKTNSNGGAWKLAGFVIAVFGSVFAAHWMWPDTTGTVTPPTTNPQTPSVVTPQVPVPTILCGKFLVVGSTCPSVVPATPSTVERQTMDTTHKSTSTAGPTAGPTKTPPTKTPTPTPTKPPTTGSPAPTVLAAVGTAVTRTVTPLTSALSATLTTVTSGLLH